MQFKEASSEEIQEILKENDVTKIPGLLGKIRQQRRHDELLSVVLHTCIKEENFKINNDLMNAMAEEYLPKLGALSAFDHAVKLIQLIRANNSRSTTSSLLQKLVFSAQLLSASKLRTFVKSELVELHAQLFSEDRETSAVLSIIIFYTLLMEISYSASLSNSELDELKKAWEKVMSVEGSEKSAILQLTSFAFYTALGEDASRFVKNISRGNLLGNLMNDCAGTSVVNKWTVIVEYDYLVLQFIVSNLSMIASTFSKKKLPQLIDFLVGTSARYQLLKELADEMTKLPNLRYGGRMELFENLFFAALDSRPSIDKNIFLGPNTLFSGRKRKSLEVESTSSPQKVKKSEIKDKQHEEYTWQDFIDVVEKADELKKLLRKASSAQLKAMIETLFSSSDTADPSLQDLLKLHCQKVLVLLRFFITNRKGFQVEFHEKIVDFMVSERGLKTNSLRLAAQLLASNRGEPMPMFISLCIGFFVPVAAKYFRDRLTYMENFAIDHAYLLAKLEFLAAVFKYFPKVAQMQAYLIGSLLPDFFLQLSVCKKEELYLESEQLEHKLSTLCKAIKGQKEAFHKFIPFVLSCSLTGEREINFPTYVLLSICDDHDLAVLSTNLPPQEKKKYANIQAQFYSMNKIIG